MITFGTSYAELEVKQDQSYDFTYFYVVDCGVKLYVAKTEND